MSKPHKKYPPSFTPSVRYSYTVKGTKYDGYRITLIGTPTDLKSAQAQAAKYPVGASVPVHYNPASPSESILEPTNQSANHGTVILGLVFVVIGLFGGWLFLRKSK